MSLENVEIVRRGYEAYARGDVAAMLADVDPEMITYREEPDGATFKGREGFLEAIAEWVEDFDEFVATAEELIDAIRWSFGFIKRRPAPRAVLQSRATSGSCTRSAIRRSLGWTCSPARTGPWRRPGSRSSDVAGER
jgi:hypothetical protein